MTDNQQLQDATDQVPEDAGLTVDELEKAMYQEKESNTEHQAEAGAEAATKKAYPMGFQAGRESRESETEDLRHYWAMVEYERSKTYEVLQETRISRDQLLQERNAAQAQVAALVEFARLKSEVEDAD